MVCLGGFSLLVVLSHAAWKWGGAGGKSYEGTIGTLGPAFLERFCSGRCSLPHVSALALLFSGRVSRENRRAFCLFLHQLSCTEFIFLFMAARVNAQK
jgi:hypothetical protein